MESINFYSEIFQDESISILFLKRKKTGLNVLKHVINGQKIVKLAKKQTYKSICIYMDKQKILEVL